MNLNTEIKSNLVQLFTHNYEPIKNMSFDDCLNSLQTSEYLDDSEINKLEALRNHTALKESFENAIKLSINDNLVIVNFKNDILTSFEKVNTILLENHFEGKNQVVFLEHDYETFATFNGLGEGIYPILKEPAYLEIDDTEVFYYGVGKIDFTAVWKDMTILNHTLEIADLLAIFDSSKEYKQLKNSYLYKTYLLLHEAFTQLETLPIEPSLVQKPFYIYGNEHDCEAINLYVYSLPAESSL